MFEKINVMIDGKPVSVLVEKQAHPNSLPFPRPVCFIVGLSSHYHDKFSEQFRNFYQLVLIDLYWTTDSKFTASYIEKLEMDTLSKHIELVRKQLEEKLGTPYEKIFIAAHSAYGFISIDYALKYPAKLFGVINIASPFIFNEELLIEWQEEYINANFGNPKLHGPTERFISYYKQKEAITEQKEHKHEKQEDKVKQSKKTFIEWYISMGPLFWKNPAFWQNPKKQREIWNPWEISVVDSITGDKKKEKRDVNMPMLNRYIKLAGNLNCYDKLREIEIPLLWVISLYDSRVSIYQLELENMKDIQNITFFHPAGGSHWPMYPKDEDTKEFDLRVLNWGGEILIENYCQNTLPPSAKL